MGKAIEAIAQSRGHEIVHRIDINSSHLLEKEHLSQADVAIEFTTPETAFSNILKCFDANVPLVCGTTGWLEKLPEVPEHGGIHNIQRISRHENQHGIVHILPVCIPQVLQVCIAVLGILIDIIRIAGIGDPYAVGVAEFGEIVHIPDENAGADTECGIYQRHFPVLAVVHLAEAGQYGGVKCGFTGTVFVFITEHQGIRGYGHWRGIARGSCVPALQGIHDQPVSACCVLCMACKGG